MMRLKYPGLWRGCVGAWCPVHQRFPASTLIDYSPNNNHGTLTNMDITTDWIVSDRNRALDFDGSNDYVALVERGDGHQNISYSFWAIPGGTITVNTESTSAITGLTGQKYALADRYIDSPDCGLGVSMGTNGISVYAHSGYGGGTITPLASHSVTISSSEMTHVAVTVSAVKPSIWLNGSLVRTGLAWPHGAVKITNGIAGRPSTYGFFPGKVDDVMFFNRSLGANEVSMLASRRGIAYETVRNRKYMASGGGGGSRNASYLTLLGVS